MFFSNSSYVMKLDPLEFTGAMQRVFSEYQLLSRIQDTLGTVQRLFYIIVAEQQDADIFHVDKSPGGQPANMVLLKLQIADGEYFSKCLWFNFSDATLLNLNLNASD